MRRFPLLSLPKNEFSYLSNEALEWLAPKQSHRNRLIDPRLDVPARRVAVVWEKGVDASSGLLGVLGVHCIFRLAVLFRDGEDAQRSHRFEWVGRFRMDHTDANG